MKGGGRVPPPKPERKKTMMTAAEFFTKTDLKALTEKLNAANGRATARTLDIDACIEHLTDFENSLRISKKAMTGTKAIVHATMETLPGAYRYRAYSTKASFEYDGKHWRFKEAERSTLKQKGCAYHVEASLSDSAKQAIVSKYELN